MKISPNKKSMRYMSLSEDYVFELKEWVRQRINEAEKNGDICKRNQFLALRAELF